MSELIGFVRVYAAFLPQLVAAYVFLERTLTPRWPVALRVAQVAAAVLMVLPVGDTTTTGTVLFVGVVMPLLFYGDDIRMRLLVTSLLVTVTQASSLAGIALWMIAAGGAESSSVAASLAHYPAHVVSSLLSAAVSALVLWAFQRQLSSVRAGIRGHEARLVAFLLMQALSLDQLGRGIMFHSPSDAPLFWGAATLGVAFLAADVEALRAMGRLRVREAEERRVERMSRAVEELSAGMQREVDALAEVSMLRHDIRNHLQVLETLVDQGESSEAAAYARTLAAGWTGSSEQGARHEP